jgi:hypothetical protein
MLPLGRKNARRCSECGITCHANCSHLVPDFCGMSMETANELLRNVRDINRLKGDKAARPIGRPHIESHVTSPSIDSQMGGAIDRVKLTGAEPGTPAADGYGRPLPSPASDRQYQQQQQQQQQQYVQPPVRPPTGARIPVPPGYPQDARPPPGAYDPGVPGSLDGYSAGYLVNHFFSFSKYKHGN